MATLRQNLTDDALLENKFRELMGKVREYRPNDDLSIIERAYRFSLQHHKGQTRASGEPYLIHPLEVSTVLAEMKLDPTAISAGLLHDAVEDTPVTTQDIERLFGHNVAHIVEGVTKIAKINIAHAHREERQAENVRKMLLAMVDDIRVVLIKLADRLHNMRTLQHLKSEQQQTISRETLDIYAPIAHRLGMGKVRGELEDLAFQYVDPIAYKQTYDAVEAKRASGEKFLHKIVGVMETKMKENSVIGRVEWRIKRLYSVYLKLQRQQINVDQVFDLLALRIITTSVKDCYAMLGTIHSMWRPVPGRIKDFIAMPRPNLYQSLHTTVMADGGMQFEVQIRTEEMHKIAEEGIAAHWKYKDGAPVSAEDEQRLAWVRQMVEWQRDISDPNEFLSTLKVDLYPEEVYTFTPKGKVVILPRGACAIDFAYAIHTEVGHTCTGARANGRLVPLKYTLRNGDILEIITQQGHNPSRDWLTFAKSSRARNKIRHWLNDHQRQRAIEIGKKLLEREARKYRASLSKVTDADYTRAASDYGLTTQQDLLAAIGYGKYSARSILAKLVPDSTSAVAQNPDNDAGGLAGVVRRVFSTGTDALQVEGHNELLVYRARCCNPIRGEEIVGYVTRGKGVAVHARNCPNVTSLLYESDRRIAVEWTALKAEASGKPGTYPVKLEIFVDDRAGMLKELTAVVSDNNTNIRNIESKTGEGYGEAKVNFVIDIEDMRHLQRLTAGLRKIAGVRYVQRVKKL